MLKRTELRLRPSGMIRSCLIDPPATYGTLFGTIAAMRRIHAWPRALPVIGRRRRKEGPAP
jgi:hypothetical protein